MSFVAVAIGGSALIGAGASIYSGSQQADAAEAGSKAQQEGLDRATRTSVAGGQQALAQLDPFLQTGLRAGTTLEQSLYSSQQRQGQTAQERIRLQGEIDRLKASMIYNSTPGQHEANLITGSQVRQAQAKLKTLEAQAQAAEAQAGQAPAIQESPWYQFQADLLGRTQDRAFAARGLTGSGFEAEERRRGLIELGAGETERQFGRLKGLYDVGANAAAQGAGAITGTAQSVSQNQIASGQAQAQGLYGVAGANANMATGIANSATGAVGAGLNYYQFQNLINANKPVPPTNTTPWRATNTDLNAYG